MAFETIQGRLSVFGIQFADGEINTQDARTILGIISEPDTPPPQPPTPPLPTVPDQTEAFEVLTVNLIAPLSATILFVLDDSDVKTFGTPWPGPTEFTNPGPEVRTVKITTYCFNEDGDSGVVSYSFFILPPAVVDPDPVEPEIPNPDVELPVASISDIDLDDEEFLVNIPAIDEEVNIT